MTAFTMRCETMVATLPHTPNSTRNFLGLSAVCLFASFSHFNLLCTAALCTSSTLPATLLVVTLLRLTWEPFALECAGADTDDEAFRLLPATDFVSDISQF